MTLPRFAAVVEHWKRVPPLASSVACIARALGAVPASQDASDGDKERQGSELAALLGSNGFNQGVPEWLKE